MISAVDFVSLDSFNSLRLQPDMAVVSIGDPASTAPAIPPEIPNHRAEFLDMTPEELETYGMDADCLPQHADIANIVGFLQMIQAKADPIRVVVHCRKGISRSAAVALIAHALSGCSFPRRPDAFDANRYVLQLAQAALSRSIVLPDSPVPGISWTFKPSTLLI